MFVEWLVEYLTVAKHLNITRAARELNMTQPNLSRHIQQVERELGFDLLAHNGSKISLTHAGREFADEIGDLLKRYDELVKHCKTISLSEYKALTVQEPLYSDEVATAYFNLLEQIKEKHLVSYTYETVYHSSISQCLKDRKLDIALSYVFEGNRSYEDDLRKADLTFIRIASIPLGVWISADHNLANIPEMTVELLAQVPILTPNDVHSPMRTALSTLFDTYDLKPIMRAVNTTSQTEFMRYQDSTCAFVFPLASQWDYRLRTRSDLRVVPMEKGILFNLLAVSRAEDNLFANIGK